jgi:dihydroorotase
MGKMLSTIIFMMILFSAGTTESVQKDNLGIYYQTAVGLQDMKKYDEAIALYNKILKEFPNDENINNAWFQLARCYKDAGKENEAVEPFLKVSRKNKNLFTTARLFAAQALMKANKYQEALDVMKYAVEDTSAIESVYRLSQFYIMMGSSCRSMAEASKDSTKFNDALTYYNKSYDLSVPETREQTAVYRATVLIDLGQYNQAESDLNELMNSTDPKIKRDVPLRIAMISVRQKKSIPALAQQNAQYDLLLKGGQVIDPANRVNTVMDVAVQGSVIALVAKNIPAGEAKKVIDVSGYIVTPGFIDMHVHAFFTFFITAARSVIPDDKSFISGVTTVVDAGTSGAKNFAEFKKLIDMSKIRILAFINISATGMDDGEQNPLEFNVPLAVETAKKYPKIIVGFKTAHYWTNRPYDPVHTPWASVDSLVEAGRLANLPVMVDFYPRPAQGDYPARSYHDLILMKLRPGDIHTHNFAAHFPVIDDDGKVNPDLFEAQKKGVIFDLGHGAGSFVYRNAVPAIKQGFIPNTISTDLHGANSNGPVITMIHVMSKLLNLGLPLEDIIRRSTINPANAIHHPELGNLSPGSSADIAVIKLVKGDFAFLDSSGGKLPGDKKLECMMTVSGGKVVYDPNAWSFPEYDKIPKDSSYWKNPTGMKR